MDLYGQDVLVGKILLVLSIFFVYFTIWLIIPPFVEDKDDVWGILGLFPCPLWGVSIAWITAVGVMGAAILYGISCTT